MANQNIAFLTANDGIEQVELTSPWKAVKEAGYEPHLIAIQSGTVQGRDGLDRQDTFDADKTLDQANPKDYLALVLPGGVANPDTLRAEKKALKFVQDMLHDEKVVAAICHAPWTLAEADVIKGRQLTSVHNIKTDLINAGGEWKDKDVVVCKGGPGILITSRTPDDLEIFNKTLLDYLKNKKD
ncbi:type 1 glutamine amidotransferase domain-containing protein [Bartonella tamiae]|uniref:PfpI family intracellular protease n=1 Tax=Bartonella tamiae Th239 TaxID=1094558 RepID=J1JVX3_9HYPH|nr:type 1 glutamine amidotransferase domain-containing protein [Bartonella tamiae]EJF89132.1 PfpI family intracellular protease [Bartonella tamiae Th239]EJF95465.1 PfpI family intracellular protease [Bartonella tamiae Th307]